MVRTPRPACALLMAVPLWLAGCLDAPIETRPEGPGNGNSNGSGNGNTEPCTLNDSSLQPGQFESSVMPGLQQNCGVGGCHDAGSAQGGYAIFGGAYLSPDIDENCDFVASIEAFVEFADRQNPGESAMLRAIDGRTPHSGGTWEVDQTPRPEITAYLESIVGGGGGGDEALAAFEADIQPILDNTGGQGCALGPACHENGAGGFTLNVRPASGSAEMRENFDESVARSNPADPASSSLVVQATTSHFGSPAVSASEQQALIDWIASLSN
jgi:hypothetical protein